MSEREANNFEMQNEYRAFLSLYDYAEDDERLYFANTNYNALVIVDKSTWTVEQLIPFKGERLISCDTHLRCVKREGKICFLPAKSQNVHIYDIEEKNQYICNIPNDNLEEKGRWGYFCYDDQVYLLPGSEEQGLWKWNISKNVIESERWWTISVPNNSLWHGDMDDNCFYTVAAKTSQLYVTNMSSRLIESFTLPDRHILHITYDGENFWYASADTSDIVCWNREQGEIGRYHIEEDIYWEYEVPTCLGMCHVAGNLLLFLANSQAMYSIYRLVKSEWVLVDNCSAEYERGAVRADEIVPNFKKVNNKLFCLLKNAGETVCIDLETWEVRQYSENFIVNATNLEYVYSVLLDRGALLYEVPDVVDLNVLIKCCAKNDLEN